MDSAIFYSNDIEAVIPFYRDILGFKIDYQLGDKFISFIFPNGGRLGIKKRREEREIPGHQTVFISCDNIDQKYAECKSKKLQFAKELNVQPWGTEFSILDADGNKVLFIDRKKSYDI